VIVDAGSTDATQERVRVCLASNNGTLSARKWKDFAYNRNEALAPATGVADDILFMDADETLVVPKDFDRSRHGADAYFIASGHAGTTYGRLALARARFPWTSEGGRARVPRMRFDTNESRFQPQRLQDR
jgi:glycosyltransferase involved in cell wall biosynthesis